jgi:2-isopropylmalate synthase
MAEYVKIFDTTLRDGEQSPGFALSAPQKVEMGHQLARLGVDVIEAGTPAASPEDFAAVQRIAREVEGPIIAALARATAADIDQCWDAIHGAHRPRIHTFLPPTDIHLEPHRREPARDRVREMVVYARHFTDDVEFSTMDATRADWAYICELFEEAIGAGATTVNVPDTCGFVQPEELATMIAYIREHVPNIDRATLSVHCHNDLGLAVANSLAAIKAGARQIECCINGIGERAGNAALEELVMALSVRPDVHHVEHGIKIEELLPASQLLQQFTGIPVQPNKAIVGENAFGHDNGQDAMLEEYRRYEEMAAAAVGVQGALGRHSGQQAVRRRLEELGLLLSHEEMDHAFAGFKRLTAYQKEVTDEDLVRIAQHGRRAAEGVVDAIGHLYR